MTDTIPVDRLDPRFAAASDVLVLVSNLLGTVDWDALAVTLSKADALGPILDPTAYRDSLANGTPARNRRVVNATRDYLAELREVADD